MPTLSLKFPNDIRAALVRRYQNQKRIWLTGDGQWPLEFSLGTLTEENAQRQFESVRAWIESWKSWHEGGEVSFLPRHWRVLGTQELPARIIFKDEIEVAKCIGESHRWERASKRFQRLTMRWPPLAQLFSTYYDILADYASEDIDRLEAMIGWLQANPNSNLYPRQLPIQGLDTKWLEVRKSLIAELMRVLFGNSVPAGDFYQICGLRQPPHRLRMKILDETLRRSFGGLSDKQRPQRLKQRSFSCTVFTEQKQIVPLVRQIENNGITHWERSKVAEA